MYKHALLNVLRKRAHLERHCYISLSTPCIACSSNWFYALSQSVFVVNRTGINKKCSNHLAKEPILNDIPYLAIISADDSAYNEKNCSQKTLNASERVVFFHLCSWLLLMNEDYFLIVTNTCIANEFWPVLSIDLVHVACVSQPLWYCMWNSSNLFSTQDPYSTLCFSNKPLV